MSSISNPRSAAGDFAQGRRIGIPEGVARPGLGKRPDLVDVDFSLAIHNRTGKYFIGEELFALPGLPLGDIFYWRRAAKAPPSGLTGRIIGRLQHWQVKGRTLGGPFALIPRRQPTRPLLHLDPFTVPTTQLQRRDAVLCHDLGPLTHAELFDAEVASIYRPIYDEIAAVGPHLIFVSEASREAFSTLYPLARPRTTRVIYPPMREAATSAIAEQPVSGVATPFLLTVGSIGTRKNQVRTIAAYGRSGLAEQGVALVLCGGEEPGADAVRAAAEATPGVRLLPYVSDAELSWLYGHARGFVLMSLLEGFGMPVAEAVRRGLVPLLSRGGVLREVAGPGAVDADPLDEEEIAARLHTLAMMSDTERTRRRAELAHAIERFDSAHFAEGWLAAFHDILAMGH